MSQEEDIRRDGIQLFDEHFRRLQEGSLPGDETWSDWIELATSLSERFESAGFKEAAEDLRQLIDNTKTGHIDAETEREIERDLKRLERLAVFVGLGLSAALVAITFVVFAVIFVVVSSRPETVQGTRLRQVVVQFENT